MLDHELFLFGGEQIAGARAKRCRGCGGRSFFLCTVRDDMGYRAHVLRRSSTPPRTPVTFSCFLHIHHSALSAVIIPRRISTLHRNEWLKQGLRGHSFLRRFISGGDGEKLFQFETTVAAR
jgi:hypothetical protein